MELLEGIIGLVFVFVVGGLLGYGISKGKKEVEDLPELPEEESELCELVPVPSRFFVSAVGIKAKGARSYVNIVTDRLKFDCPTEKDLEDIRSRILGSNPEFKECFILSFQRIFD